MREPRQATSVRPTLRLNLCYFKEIKRRKHPRSIAFMVVDLQMFLGEILRKVRGGIISRISRPGLGL